MNVDPYGYPDAAAPTADVAPGQAASRWATTLVVPPAVGLASFAWYSARSMQWMIAQEAAIDPATLSGIGTGAGFIGLVAGIALGAGLGGAAAASGGLLLFVVGAGLMLGGLAKSAVLIMGIGRYMFNVGALAALARGPRTESGRIAAYAGTYALLNVAAMSTALVTWTGSSFGYGWPVGIGAAIGAIVLLPMVGVAAAHLVRPPEVSNEAVFAPANFVTVGIGAAIAAPAYTAWSWGAGAQWTLADQSGLSYGGIFQYLNPPTVIASATLLALVAGGLSFARIQVPGLAVAGVGMLFLAGGLIISAFDSPMTSPGLLYVAQIVMGIGEPLVFAGILARLVGGLHWRLAPLAAALLSACSLFGDGFGRLVGERLQDPYYLAFLLGIAGAVNVLSGIGLAVVGWFRRR